MSIKIDVVNLRRDLAGMFAAGAYAGTPAMMSAAWSVDQLPDGAVIDLARRNGIDLSKYAK